MSAPVLLLTVTTPARVIRIASEPVEILDADGSVLVYVAGLDGVTVSLALSWLSSGGPLSVPVQCVLPFDLALDEARGHHVAGCPAEIALWDADETGDYSARVVLAWGTVTGPEYGEIDEPVTFSVEAPASESMIEVPAATAQVDGTTWETVIDLDPVDLGLPYPRVYGLPGRISGSEWVTGSQIVWTAYGTSGVDFVAVLCSPPARMNYVNLNGDDDVAGTQFAVWQTRDVRGRECSVIAKYANYPANTLNTYVDGRGETVAGILLNAYTNPAIGAPKSVFVGWVSPLADDTGGLSPLAGDVCMDLLAQTGARIDYGRWQAAGRLLTGYRFDCVIDARTKAAAWLAANLYPLLPISVEDGPGGIYPVVWRYDARPEDATARLDADIDPGISRAGAIKEDTGQIANAFSLQYRYSVRTGTYTETITRDASTCPYCAASERRWGRIERALTTVVVYDAPTAASSLAWMARAFTSPPKRIPYLVPSGYRLQLGQVVLLTDSRIHLAEQLCLVSAVQIDGTGVDGVELLIVPDPARDG